MTRQQKKVEEIKQTILKTLEFLFDEEKIKSMDEKQFKSFRQGLFEMVGAATLQVGLMNFNMEMFLGAVLCSVKLEETTSKEKKELSKLEKALKRNHNEIWEHGPKQ